MSHSKTATVGAMYYLLSFAITAAGMLSSFAIGAFVGAKYEQDRPSQRTKPTVLEAHADNVPTPTTGEGPSGTCDKFRDATTFAPARDHHAGGILLDGTQLNDVAAKFRETLARDYTYCFRCGRTTVHSGAYCMDCWTKDDADDDSEETNESNK